MKHLLPSAAGQTVQDLMAHLAIADPKAAQLMHGHLASLAPSAVIPHLDQMVAEVIAVLTIEVSLGRNLAEGMGRLLAGGSDALLDRYRHLVKDAATRGPTLASLFARYLVPVLLSGDARLENRFETTIRVMLRKGTYTLKAPLETLAWLIEENEQACAHAFLDLLTTTYALDTSYNRTVYLTHTLPRAVQGFAPSRRLWQIRGLTRIMREAEQLADAYLEGLASGLQLLSEVALNEFLDQTLRQHQKDANQVARFLALKSRRAEDRCHDLQVAVPLSAIRSSLERYLWARTGLAVAVRPLGALSPALADRKPGQPLVRCDGRNIYLPEEIDLLDRPADNAALYKLLIRLEAGSIEFGTYELDVEKALAGTKHAPLPPITQNLTTESDLARLIRRFERPDMALDMFTLFEHGRIARNVHQRYPGLFRRLTAALGDRHLQDRTGYRTGGTLLPLYRHLVMNENLVADPGLNAMGQAMKKALDQVVASGDNAAESSARLVVEFYAQMAGYVAANEKDAFDPLVLPFGRRLDPSLFGSFHTTYHRLAADIRTHLAQRNLRTYRSDIQRLLVRQGGEVSAADIRPLIVNPATRSTPVDLSWLDLASLECSHHHGQSASTDDDANAFRYREWDWCMGDYLSDHVRVVEREVNGINPEFYRQTIHDFRGLVKRIRYAFELLRPEEMTILRQWRDGDAFDYRALLNYILDKRAGLMPSDRLFIKRIKRIRDVAALLLVDLSRSTANAADDRGTRVLDVEKQAIVLLCEAWKVVGDRFAIAGFSGTGPLGVDYFRIKDLNTPFDDAVKGRIGAMAPQRSTRMGAAIRHATALFATVQARVRLMIILGDGFPNDLAYKGAYAVEDTRRAVVEARAAGIHVKAITVNVSANDQLDQLYGRNHHTRIGNVHDLPDKLVRVYSALTRH
jgi:hypothetical protein